MTQVKRVRVAVVNFPSLSVISKSAGDHKTLVIVDRRQLQRRRRIGAQ